MAKKKTNKEEKKDVSLKEYLAAQQELEELRKANGIAVEDKGITKVLNKFFNTERTKHRVKKKTYIILGVFLGWCGGHRFYEHRWILACIYAALGIIMFPQLAGFPLAMTIIDIMIIIPMPKDEEGYVWI